MRGLSRPRHGARPLRPIRALNPIHVLPFLALILLLTPAPGAAQYDTAPPPAAWALEGVTVVHPGAEPEEDVTIVVRNGLIETLAAGAPVPSGVRVIGWDEGTLWIYPGIVDAHGNASTSFPAPSREGVESWNPTREVQFFTPHRVTADFLTAGGEDLAAHRRRGVVASAVYPGRGIMPGQPSLILHRTDARTARDLVLRPSLGVAMAFQGAQGAYPGTLMAQHAFIRQTFHDAAHDGARAEAYRNSSNGLSMTTGDADYAIVRQMAAGDLPVLFRADDAGEIRRVLALSDELGFEPIIVGGQEAGLMAEELSERGVPVLLSSRMPSPTDWDPEVEDDEEISPAAFRERQRMEPVFRTPATLAEHGVSFAFTSGGEGAVDMLDGIRKAIEYGLDPDDALRALTTWPAEFLGVPELARVRQGGTATFIVTDGPIFDEGRSVTWTFVNGQPEKGADPRTVGEAAADDEDASASDFAGTWEGTIDAPGQQVPLRMELRADGDDLEGEISTGGGDSTALQNVRIEGATLRFEVSVAELGGARSSYTATVDDDLMRGTGEFATPGGSFSFNFELRRSPAGDNR